MAPASFKAVCDYCGADLSNLTLYGKKKEHNFVNGVCSICNCKQEEIEWDYEIVSAKDKTISLGITNLPIDDYEITELHIPSTYYGYKVVQLHDNSKIDGNLFNFYHKLRKIYLPKSITKYKAQLFSCPYYLDKESYKLTDEKVSYDLYYEGDLNDWLNIEFGLGDYEAKVGMDFNPLYYANNLYFNNELVKDIVIPENVTKINSFAFVGEAINSLLLHDKLESIGSCIISKNTNINLTEYENGLYLGTNTNPYYMLVGNNKEDTLRTHEKCEIIGSEAFLISDVHQFVQNYGEKNFNCVKNIYITKNVKKFNRDAVLSCESIYEYLYYFMESNAFSPIENLYYEGTLADWINIDFEMNSPFEYQTHDKINDLGSNYVTSNPIIISNNVYFNNTPIIKNRYDNMICYNIEIPQNIKEIKPGVLFGLIYNQLTLPKSVEKINAYALGNPALVNYQGSIEDWCNIEFSSVTANPFFFYYRYDNQFAFYDEDGNYYHGQRSLKINDTIYGYYSINNEGTKTSLLEIEIPKSVKKIGYAQFCCMYFINNVTFHDEITEIGDYAFAGATSAFRNEDFEYKELILPNKIKSIGTGAFMDTSYKFAWIPKTVEYLGFKSFKNEGFFASNGYWYPSGIIYYEGNNASIIPSIFTNEYYSKSPIIFEINKDNIVAVERKIGENIYINYYYIDNNEATLMYFEETSFTDIRNNNNTLVIPDYITVNGKNYNVTKIIDYSINNGLNYGDYLKLSKNVDEIGYIFNYCLYVSRINILTENKNLKISEYVDENYATRYNIEFVNE